MTLPAWEPVAQMRRSAGRSASDPELDSGVANLLESGDRILDHLTM